MKKCISYWSIPGGLENTLPIADALAAAKDAGFEGLELGIGPEGVLTTQSSQSDCENIRKQIDGAGLTVETLASGMSWGANPTSNDPAVRRKSIELHAAALQRAAWTGCKAMLFVPGVVTSPIAPDEVVRYDTAVDRVREAVRELLEVAEKVQVDLCLENVWNGLLLSPLEWMSLIDEFKSDRLGMYFDVGNLLGYHQHPPHWIELLGSRIKRVHIKDFKDNFGWDGTYSFAKLGEGDVPWPETVAALKGIGYDRTVVAEMLPPSDGLLEHTKQAMDRIFN
ncbi:sugar phosphate isomerase/epimerase family protein [Phycisphaerales bacterium AB-hyl4]|uniref:Sugar phosphate isomerase/epimerase family protein n=1 Tax=Natronomicrosphaera hydrolytica TaxID=3242702 RepID=A0ABV4UAC9_9BACT